MNTWGGKKNCVVFQLLKPNAEWMLYIWFYAFIHLSTDWHRFSQLLIILNNPHITTFQTKLSRSQQLCGSYNADLATTAPFKAILT